MKETSLQSDTCSESIVSHKLDDAVKEQPVGVNSGSPQSFFSSKQRP